MNIKKEVFKQIAEQIDGIYNLTRIEIFRNKFKIKALAKEQAVLKRKKAEIQELYNYCIKRKEIEGGGVIIKS